MRVRCRAAAESRSNAVGRLELECTGAGLSIALIGVARYRPGYAPGLLAEPTTLCIPWQAVRVARLGSQHLLLLVDEQLSALNAFFLGEFARVEASPRRWARRSSSASHITLGDFCYELSQGLGYPVPLESETAREQDPLSAHVRPPPRTAVGAGILVVAGSLAALMLGRSPSVAPLPPPNERSVRAEPALASAPSSDERLLNLTLHPRAPHSSRPDAAHSAAGTRPPALGPGCECIRHESVLWQQAPPRISLLVTDQHRRAHGSHEHVELELSAINNTDREMERLHLKVVFYPSDLDAAAAAQAPVTRELFFKGPLAPGRLVRWKTQARASRFEVQMPDLGRLDDDGIDTAPADAFLELATSQERSVQLHAGMMLAFLGDARAPDALLRLGAPLQGDEQEYYERVLDGTGELRVCELMLSSSGPATRVQACLYNAANQPRSDLELQVRALGSSLEPENPSATPPALLAEQALRVSGVIAPHRGRRIELVAALDGGGVLPDGSIELVVARPRVVDAR